MSEEEIPQERLIEMYDHFANRMTEEGFTCPVCQHSTPDHDLPTSINFMNEPLLCYRCPDVKCTITSLDLLMLYV
jgi:hypothetical protein